MKHISRTTSYFIQKYNSNLDSISSNHKFPYLKLTWLDYINSALEMSEDTTYETPKQHYDNER